jgi:glycosyltransferase involved in cell wall biosynthesis
MRVLHVVPSLDPETGGPARWVPALCRALRAAGVAASICTFRRADSTAAISSEESLRVRSFVPLKGTREFPTPAFYREIVREIEQVDLVHLHSLWNPAISVTALACRQVRVPYLVSPMGMLQATAMFRRWPLKQAYYWLCERRTIVGAAAFHFFTEAEASDSQRLLRHGRPRSVVPGGIDPRIAAGLEPGRFRRAYPALAGKRLMLFLGRLHWSKGLEVQAEAFARLGPEFPDLVWVLIGPDGGQWRRLSRHLSANGLARRVLWTGLLPQGRCLDALADSDVFVLTSRHEAHSMAMNEALAVGVPVVITDTVRFDEVRAWGAGRVVAREAREVAAAVADILAHPEGADRMRRAGHRLVAERLAWPKVAAAMVKAYHGILADGDAPGRKHAPRHAGAR